MALIVKIGDEQEEEVKHEPISVELNIRKTIDGNILIFDHPDVDISILLDKNKVVVFPKERISDKTYDVQDRLFKNLFQKGLIGSDTIQGGNVYGSMEAQFQETDEASAVQMLILVISKFIKEENKFISIGDKAEEEFEDSLTEPEQEDSTELGEIPHTSQKGSIRPGYIYSPYGISSIYRYE